MGGITQALWKWARTMWWLVPSATEGAGVLINMALCRWLVLFKEESPRQQGTLETPPLGQIYRKHSLLVFCVCDHTCVLEVNVGVSKYSLSVSAGTAGLCNLHHHHHHLMQLLSQMPLITKACQDSSINHTIHSSLSELCVLAKPSVLSGCLTAHSFDHGWPSEEMHHVKRGEGRRWRHLAHDLIITPHNILDRFIPPVLMLCRKEITLFTSVTASPWQNIKQLNVPDCEQCCRRSLWLIQGCFYILLDVQKCTSKYSVHWV